MNAYYLNVHLADHEWGGDVMREAAREAFARHPGLEPMCVEVHEHAGWYLTFLRDGTIVGTANDRATSHLARSRAFNARCEGHTWKHLPSIRRPNLVAMEA